MTIVEYTPDHFPDLQEMVSRLPAGMNLAHRPFVDYFYTTAPWSKLYMLLSDSGRVLGTIGRELVRFELDSREIMMRNGSNWFSLQPGIGGKLLKHSTEANPNTIGMMLVASRDAIKVFDHYKWVSIPGVAGYFLNGCTLYPRDSWWRNVANSAVRLRDRSKLSRLASRIPADVGARITVCEEHAYSPDLLPRRSPFRFRFAPPIEFLKWRYNLSLSFVRYRLFRIMAEGNSVGYVILNDYPGQVIVAQCDGEEVTSLAYGILLAIARACVNDQRPRTVFLSSCHAEMRRIFEQFGFRSRGGHLPFAFHTLPPSLDLSAGTSDWLVNYDWSDNGLQPPFLDQLAGR